MSASYTDSRYFAFISPRKERIETYSANRKAILLEFEKEKEFVSNFRKEKEEEKEKLIAEGYTKRQARKIVNPSLLQIKDRLRGEKDKRDLALKKNRVLIYPYKFFYKAVEYDGNGLLKPRFHVLLSLLVVLLIASLSLIFMELNNAQFLFDNFGFIIARLFGPYENMALNSWDKWLGYMWGTAVPAIWETFEMMFIATSIGSILAIPFMILCSENIVIHRSVTRFFRVLLNIIRTFPTMVLAIFGVAFFGIGSKAGILAMVIFTMGIMIKLMYERIETVDMHPFEAAISTGGTRPKAFVTSIAPQILPDYLSNVIYTFEINIRASVILGFVNAGGIGKLIQDAMNTYEYNKIGAILIPLLVLVLVLTWLSSLARRITQ